MDQIVCRNVYVVDDDDAVRDSMRALLESCGLRVRDYSSAQAFLDDSGKPARGCLLLDLHMPGMSGVELLENLQNQDLLLPVIVLTGRSDPAVKARVLRAGAVALLDKPVDETMLMKTLGMAFLRSADA